MIENALRYSEGDIEVLSYFNSNKKYVVIAVNDSGPGIPESELESVFEPFKQGDAARGSEGSAQALQLLSVLSICMAARWCSLIALKVV